MPSKDIAEKLLESYNDVFADIVNALLFEGEQVVSPDSLVDAQKDSFYKMDGTLHEQERDIAKLWQVGGVRFALYGIENQAAYDRDMPLRVIGYDGANYRAQLGEKVKYPVVTLVLYFGTERWKNRNLFDIMVVPDELKPYVNDYHINVFEIARLSEAEITRFHSDFRIVADYIVHSRTNPEYKPTDLQRFEHTNELLKLMSAITNDTRFEQSIDRKGGSPKNMWEALDRIEQRGIAIGLSQGIEEGMQKGKLQGIEEGIAQGLTAGKLEQARVTALNMRRAGMTDPSMIAALNEVPVELVERWFEEENQ